MRLKISDYCCSDKKEKGGEAANLCGNQPLMGQAAPYGLMNMPLYLILPNLKVFSFEVAVEWRFLSGFP